MGKRKKTVKRKKGLKKDPNAPKREPSAFIKFSGKMREGIKKEHPDWKMGDISKECGRLWGLLSTSEKAGYADAVDQYARRKRDRDSDSSDDSSDSECDSDDSEDESEDDTTAEPGAATPEGIHKEKGESSAGVVGSVPAHYLLSRSEFTTLQSNVATLKLDVATLKEQNRLLVRQNQEILESLRALRTSSADTSAGPPQSAETKI